MEREVYWSGTSLEQQRLVIFASHALNGRPLEWYSQSGCGNLEVHEKTRQEAEYSVALR